MTIDTANNNANHCNYVNLARSFLNPDRSRAKKEMFLEISKLSRDNFNRINQPPVAPPPPATAQQQQIQPPIPLAQRNLWTWIKDTLSNIVAFFKRLFGCSANKPVASKPTPLNIKLELEKIKGSENPQEWNKLINFLNKYNPLKRELELKTKGQTITPSEKEDLEEIYNANKRQIWFELLKVIHRNGATKADLELCLKRLGTIPGITGPAPLNNHHNNCYIDSLLQMLFASKGFIELLKNTDVDPQYLNQNPGVVVKTFEDAEKDHNEIKKAYTDTKKAYDKAIIIAEAKTPQDPRDSAKVIKAAKEKLDAAKVKFDAADGPKAAVKTAADDHMNNVLDAHLVQALKNYCFGQMAGLEKTQIRSLRNNFSDSLAPILKVKRGQIVTNQNDSSEVLGIILDALHLSNEYMLTVQTVKTYPKAGGLTSKPDSVALKAQLHPLQIPPVKEIEVSEEKILSAEILQALFDKQYIEAQELAENLNLKLKLEKPDILKLVIQREMNEKKVPSIPLQEVINTNLVNIPPLIEDPTHKNLEPFGIDGKKLDKVKNDYFADKRKYNEGKKELKDKLRKGKKADAEEYRIEFNEKWKKEPEDPIPNLQRIIDEYKNKIEELPEEERKLLEEAGIELEKVKAANHDQVNLVQIWEDAGYCQTIKTLSGNAPPFLTLFVAREGSGVGLSVNSTLIMIPADGIITVKIDGKDVTYKVVGVVGKTGGIGGGHYLANVNINGKWLYVDDQKSSKPVERSPNNNLTIDNYPDIINSRLYMLEKVQG